MTRDELGKKLLALLESARAWLVFQPIEPGSLSRSQAYAELMFAYGLARVGWVAPCRTLCQSSEARLNGYQSDALCRVLHSALTYRISQALKEEYGGWLPAQLLDDLGHDEQRVYRANRLRSQSRILEPEATIDVYGPIRTR